MQKILIVEDDHIVQDLVSATLEGDSRYELLQAFDGDSGLKMALKHHPILILLDLDLPKLHGLEICRRLKKESKYAGIYILVLSALSQNEDVQAGLAAGADDYFIKPFSPLALLRRIDEILERRPN
jgi:DNA-binding response OmpR family regulator